jgi:leucyl aminopeptidase
MPPLRAKALYQRGAGIYLLMIFFKNHCDGGRVSLLTQNRMRYSVSLSESEWDSVVQKISSASTREWFENQTGVVRVPDVLLPCVAGHLQSASSTKTLMLFKQEPEPKASEVGLLPPSNQWSALAKVKAANAHRVQTSENVEDAVASFLLSCYSYHRYQTTTTKTPLLQLSFPDSETRHDTEALVGAIYWAQDLISTPANSLTPGTLQRAAQDWAASCIERRSRNHCRRCPSHL